MAKGVEIRIRDLPPGYNVVTNHAAGITGESDPLRQEKFDAACARLAEMPVVNSRGGEVFRPS